MTVLMSGHDHHGRKAEVLLADGCFAICYHGQPISLRYYVSRYDRQTGDRMRYPKTLFPSSGQAIRQARQLNEAFGTDAFTVHRLNVGEAL